MERLQQLEQARRQYFREKGDAVRVRPALVGRRRWTAGASLVGLRDVFSSPLVCPPHRSLAGTPSQRSAEPQAGGPRASRIQVRLQSRATCS
jgi:hypothetical protein